ncbi:MAG: hypothetical protein AABX96_00580 [Nanoarchaeota archaeon]
MRLNAKTRNGLMKSSLLIALAITNSCSGDKEQTTKANNPAPTNTIIIKNPEIFLYYPEMPIPNAYDSERLMKDKVNYSTPNSYDSERLIKDKVNYITPNAYDPKKDSKRKSD